MRWLLLLPAICLAQTKQEELGRRLFNDPRLSADGTVSCSTCHREDKGFASGGIPTGLDGKPLIQNRKGITLSHIPKGLTLADYESGRSAPSLWNCANRKSYFRDGRTVTLEEQLAEVLTNQLEMGNKSVADVAKRIDMKQATMVAALVAYERSLVSAPSRLDEYLDGRDTLTAQERRGWDLFRGKAECYKCHTGKDFTDEKFHNTGVGYVIFPKSQPHQIDDALFADTDPKGGHFMDWGRAYVTLTKANMGEFKTPPLRKGKFTAPYMHDASLADLPAVVRFYNEGGRKNVNLDKNIKPLGLNRREEDDLVAILKVF